MTDSFDDDAFNNDILLSEDVLSSIESKFVTDQQRPVGDDTKTSDNKNSGKDADIDFQFPFKPYQIQTDFMKELYQTIEQGKIGVFESPTGTGKSLSLICSALCWLQSDEKRREDQYRTLNLKAQSVDNENDDWIQAFAQREQLKNEHQTFLDTQSRILQREEELRQLKRGYGRSKFVGFNRKRKLDPATSEEPIDASAESDESSSELDVVLDDYESDKDIDNDRVTAIDAERDDQEQIDIPKIIYCSRTHSQLSQFLSEFKKTAYADSIRCVVLGSRQTYCINETVRQLKQLSLLNDRCLELQRNATDKTANKREKLENSKKRSSTTGCPYYRSTAIRSFADELLIRRPPDVEELVVESREHRACGYYASRRSVSSAHLVLVPYQTLVHKPTRDACGLKLDGNVIIVDEAHNLLDTISAIHSVEITDGQIECARADLERYLSRYQKRFNPKNLMYLRQINVILNGLASCLKNTDKQCVWSLNEFLCRACVDDVNFFKLLRYMRVSMISQKLNWFAKRNQNDVQIQTSGGQESVCSPLFNVEAFLVCLSQSNKDGRIVIIPMHSGEMTATVQKQQSKLKFVHLNPAVYFKDLCTSPRSVVLAGGTMEPMTELTDQLFSPCDIAPSRLAHFSCNHIVPDENLLPVILHKGPSGGTLDFSYQYRRDEAMLRDLARILLNLTNIVPGGIIVFFTSYDYERFVYDSLTESGVAKQIGHKKKLFREPARATEVSAVLEKYAKSVRDGGAILFAVIGGKLSEGINFADDLGRLVIMVGLPFANINSVELKEKMMFLDRMTGDNTRGRRYYENLCMKAVNQSVGRVIRHANDYASILLLGNGYTRSEIREQLPCWIRKSLTACTSFGHCIGNIKQFFNKITLKYSTPNK